MIKALPKALLKSRQENANFHGHFGHGIKPPAIPWHCEDSAEVKTLQLSPTMPLLSLPSRGSGFPMTGALLGFKLLPIVFLLEYSEPCYHKSKIFGKDVSNWHFRFNTSVLYTISCYNRLC